MHVFEPRILRPLAAVLLALPSFAQNDAELSSVFAELAQLPPGDALLSTPMQGRVRLGPDEFRIDGIDFGPAEDSEDGLALYAFFAGGDARLLLPLEEEGPGEEVLLVRGDESTRVSDLTLVELDEIDGVGLAGHIENSSGERVPLAAVVAIGAGASTFRVEGDAAFLNGDLGANTYAQVDYLIREYPDVTTVVFEDVPGSMNDEVNVETGRLIRGAGYTTILLADSMIASGAVDLFCAGEVRIIEGGRIGVHSWADPGADTRPAELPRDHPAHASLVAYLSEMLDERGEDFYFFTLAAAPAEGIHWMTTEEVERFGLATEGPVGPVSGDAPARIDSPDGLYCGCILRLPVGQVPKDARARTKVLRTKDYAPFTKALTVAGITLVASDDVDDAFLELVADVIDEMMTPADAIDAEAQVDLIEALHAYRAVIPVPRTEASLERALMADGEAFERTFESNSICDIIMSGVDEGRVMEVVEHVLHIVTDVGLHYRYPDEWGISRDSLLWKAMTQAIEAGYYDVDSYDDLDGEDPEIVDRVLMQEFAYWFITTAWDLQGPYGPREDEWTLRTPDELRAALPEFFDVYRRTAGQVMSAPSRATLARIGPTRAEER